MKHTKPPLYKKNNTFFIDIFLLSILIVIKIHITNIFDLIKSKKTSENQIA